MFFLSTCIWRTLFQLQCSGQCPFAILSAVNQHYVCCYARSVIHWKMNKIYVSPRSCLHCICLNNAKVNRWVTRDVFLISIIDKCTLFAQRSVNSRVSVIIRLFHNIVTLYKGIHRDDCTTLALDMLLKHCTLTIVLHMLMISSKPLQFTLNSLCSSWN